MCLHFRFLFLKALFKQTLTVSRSVEGSETIFTCETEKEGKVAEWYKDNNKKTDNIDVQDTEDGYIHKLTIKHTKVEDRGTYKIQVNGVPREVDLEVLGNK